MILLELEIEDYKQFRGKHHFTPSTSGVVGIIGHNGAGKTTLFEAIEWCLYQPSDIKNADVPPRDAQDRRPRVRIRFARTDGGATWEIERSLRKSGAFAEVRQIDENGPTVLATGSTAVSNYVASKLIGLEYKAFVATFFTRQKELSFFGTYKPTDRRREVGRLLGLETIRSAQELIAEERRAKVAVHQGLNAQYQQQSGERDFDAERTARNEELAGIDKQLTDLEADLIKAEAAFKAADSARAELVEQRERTLNLMSELKAHQKDIAAASAAIATATDELKRLDTLEAERPALAGKADQIDAHEQRVAALEADRDRHQKRASLVDQRDQATREVVRLQESAKSALAAIQRSPGKPAMLREEDPLAGIDAALESASAINADATDALIREYEALAKEQERVSELDARLQKYRTAVEQLEQKRIELLSKGDPIELEAAAKEAHAEGLRVQATIMASIDTHRKTLGDYRLFASREQTPTGEPICQMCGRPISPDDRDHTRRHAEQRIVEIEAQIAALNIETLRQKARISELDMELDEIRARSDTLTTTRDRIMNGQRAVTDAETEFASARQDLSARMVRLSRTEPVCPEEITALVERLNCERGIERARVSLVQTRDSLASALDRVAALSVQIDEIGQISFDPGELTREREALDAGRSARERVAFIDQQLLRRTEHTAAIETAEAKRAAAQTDATRLEAEIAANPIEEYALEKADMAVARARQDEQRIRTQRENLRRGRLDIEHALRQIDADEKKLKELIERAERARVEAEDLDRMYKEFNAFEQYVARRVRPQLEDMTSELVRVITENKYESVALDDDYGVKVWDGELGPYPIEHFSGGERDVIALSARLALSRLIGSQAANPPSFLVLDEVFGSLDRDRRANVLDLLSSLAGSADAFQQLFVISHVDDVRLSPAFNEVWRVAESDDGSSRLENLNLTQGAEDL
jgi:exonuclease SbcC